MGVAVGSFNAPTGTGNITVSGLAFQPVAVLFFNTYNVEAPPGVMLGCATADDQQWVIWTGTDSEINSYTKRYSEGRTDLCIYNLAAPFTTVSYAAEFVSMNSDGFTINVTTFSVATEDIGWMAIGGEHVSQAYAGTITAGASTGTVATTDPGFTPSAAIFAHVRATAFDSGQQGDMCWGVGVTDGSNHYSSFVMGNQVNVTETRFIDRTDEIACAFDGTNTFRMALSSFDVNGLTVNVTDAWTGDITHAYLAIEAEAASAGHSTVPLTQGTETISGLNHKPEGVFFCWPGSDVSDSDGGGGTSNVWTRPGAGCFTASSAFAVSQVFRGSAPFGVFTPDGYQDAAGVAMRGSGSGIDAGDNDDVARGLYSSFAQGEFTINWSAIAFASARPYGWLALPGEIIFVPQFYRLVPGRGITTV